MTPHKIVDPLQLAPLLRSRQKQGQRVVFTNGCFDLLHVGHVRYLQSARELGDLLVVAVNSDESVRLLSKGPDRPLIPQEQRMEVLAALACVDFVVLFSDPTPLTTIGIVQPDVLVKGGDWSVRDIVGRDIVEARGGQVLNIPLVPGISTSIIIQRIRES